MLFQPSHITPSKLTNAGAVISGADTDLTWQLNGNSAMIGYSYSIYTPPASDGTSTLIKEIDKVTLSTPLYPTDSKGNPQTFSTSFTAPTIDQGTEFYLYIKQYFVVNGVEDSIETMVPAVFTVGEAPSIVLKNSAGTDVSDLGEQIFSTLYTSFTASVTSKSPVERVRWQLIRSPMNSEEDTFSEYVYDDTGYVYTGVLSYQTPFLLKGSYRIIVTAVCTNGLNATTTYDFVINYYSLPDIANSIEISNFDNIANKVTVVTPSSIQYKARTIGSGQITTDNNLQLANLATVTWDTTSYANIDVPLNINPLWRLEWTGTVAPNDNTPFLITNQFEIKRVTNGFLVQETGKPYEYEVSFNEALSGAFTGKLGIKGTSMDVVIYAESTDGTYTAEYEMTDHSLLNLTLIRLQGNNTAPLELLTQNISVFMNDFSTAAFVATFNDGNLTGVLTLTNLDLPTLLRNEIEAVTSEKFILVQNRIESVVDYSWKSKDSYAYYVAVVNSQTNNIRYMIEGDVWCKRTNAYALIEAALEEDSDTTYDMVRYWKFGANINSSEITNNNSPSMLTNFTKYRFWQRMQRQGRSGTLSALLSNVQNSSYADTARQMDELYSISESTNTFFLKDTKGNFYEIAISAPVRQTLNLSSVVQQTTVNVAWEEVGDSKGLSVVNRGE
nr:MAG TPA: hypothetical protein [Caudoviricetes sp.]